MNQFRRASPGDEGDCDGGGVLCRRHVFFIVPSVWCGGGGLGREKWVAVGVFGFGGAVG